MPVQNSVNDALLQAALRYASMGLWVFPCQPGAKEPCGPKGDSWQQQATTDPLEVALLWARYPGANIGVVCGQGAGVTVLDFDVKGGAPGLATAGQLFPAGLPPHARTPSGGVHVWCLYVHEWGNRKLKKLGLDIQGEGSYVVMPPSVVAGKPYLWVNCDGPELSGPAALGALKPRMAELLGSVGGGGEGPGGGGGEELPAGWDEVELPADLGPVWAALGDDALGFLHSGDTGRWASRSEALGAVAVALLGNTRTKLTALQVQRLLWLQEPVWSYLQEKGDPPGWLWKYNVLPALKLTRPFGGAVAATGGGGGGGGEAAEVAAEPDQMALARIEARALPPMGGDPARDFMRRMVEAGLDPMDTAELLALMHDATGVGVQVLRQQLALVTKTVHGERDREAKRVPQGITEAYVWVEQPGAFWKLTEAGWVTRSAWKTHHANDDHEVYKSLLEGVPRCGKATYRPHNPWAPDFAQAVVDGEVLWPLNETSQQRELNIWQQPSFTPALGVVVTDADVAPWLHLLDRALKVRRDEREHLLDWLACTVQFPHVKVNHMLLLGGRQGIGKDTLFEPVLRALGRSNTLVVGGDAVTEKFDFEKLSHCSLMLLEELSTSTDRREARKAYNALKTYISAPPTELPINIKGVKQFHVPNIVNVAAVTNDEAALRIEQDDRRLYPVWCDGRADAWASDAARTRYFDDLWSWYEQGGIELVVGWLLQRDLTARGFHPGARPPGTHWKAEVSDESLSPLAKLVRDLMDAEEGAWAFDIITGEEALASVNAHAFGVSSEGPVSAEKLGHAFKMLGIRHLRIKEQGVVRGRKQLRVYVLRNEASYLGDLSKVREYLSLLDVLS